MKVTYVVLKLSYKATHIEKEDKPKELNVPHAFQACGTLSLIIIMNCGQIVST